MIPPTMFFTDLKFSRRGKRKEALERGLNGEGRGGVK